MKRKIVFCLALPALLLFISCFGSLTEWQYRTQLPQSATDIHEWEMGGGDFSGPDFFYILKAKIDKKDFPAYCTRFELTLHTPDRVYNDDPMWISWDTIPNDKLGWWDPSPSIDGTYVRQKGDVWTYAKYKNGRLYLVSMSH